MTKAPLDWFAIADCGHEPGDFNSVWLKILPKSANADELAKQIDSEFGKMILDEQTNLERTT